MHLWEILRTEIMRFHTINVDASEVEDDFAEEFFSEDGSDFAFCWGIAEYFFDEGKAGEADLFLEINKANTSSISKHNSKDSTILLSYK